ncbi:hypothetical protein EON67_00195 [archaeon]|nr:MAG: hypothetical protein EON67_00195 [archaeon]
MSQTASINMAWTGSVTLWGEAAAAASFLPREFYEQLCGGGLQNVPPVKSLPTPSACAPPAVGDPPRGASDIERSCEDGSEHAQWERVWTWRGALPAGVEDAWLARIAGVHLLVPMVTIRPVTVAIQVRDRRSGAYRRGCPSR